MALGFCYYMWIIFSVIWIFQFFLLFFYHGSLIQRFFRPTKLSTNKVIRAHNKCVFCFGFLLFSFQQSAVLNKAYLVGLNSNIEQQQKLNPWAYQMVIVWFYILKPSYMTHSKVVWVCAWASDKDQIKEKGGRDG